jgi:hypothetical protein
LVIDGEVNHQLQIYFNIIPTKKIDVFSPEKNGDTRCKLRLFRAECGQLGRAGLNGLAGQLGHIQW